MPGGVVGKNALALYITIPICLLIFWLSPTLIGLGVIAIIMVPVVLQIILSYRDAGTENAIALLKQMASKQGQIPINEPVHPPPVQLGGPGARILVLRTSFQGLYGFQPDWVWKWINDRKAEPQRGLTQSEF